MKTRKKPIITSIPVIRPSLIDRAQRDGASIGFVPDPAGPARHSETGPAVSETGPVVSETGLAVSETGLAVSETGLASA